MQKAAFHVISLYSNTFILITDLEVHVLTLSWLQYNTRVNAGYTDPFQVLEKHKELVWNINKYCYKTAYICKAYITHGSILYRMDSMYQEGRESVDLGLSWTIFGEARHR